MPINNYFMQKIDKASIYIKYQTSGFILIYCFITYKQLFYAKIDKASIYIRYQTSGFILIYCFIRNKSKYGGRRANCILYIIPTDMFSIFLISAKSNDITEKFAKSILVQKIAYTSIYDSTMSHKQFELKNK